MIFAAACAATTTTSITVRGVIVVVRACCRSLVVLPLLLEVLLSVECLGSCACVPVLLLLFQSHLCCHYYY